MEAWFEDDDVPNCLSGSRIGRFAQRMDVRFRLVIAIFQSDLSVLVLARKNLLVKVKSRLLHSTGYIFLPHSARNLIFSSSHDTSQMI